MRCDHSLIQPGSRFCHVCGAKIDEFNIVSTEEDKGYEVYQEVVFIQVEKLIAQGNTSTTIQVLLENPIVDVEYYFEDIDTEDIPSWVTIDTIRKLSTRVLNIQKGEKGAINIDINCVALADKIEKFIEGECSEDDITLTLKIHSGVDIEFGKIAPHVRQLILRPEIPCLVTPNASIYRFLDQEKLRKKVVEHCFTLVNISPHPVSIKSIQCQDYLVSSRTPIGFTFDVDDIEKQPLHRIPTYFCVKPPKNQEIVIAPLEQEDVYVSIVNPSREQDVMGWFASDIMIYHDRSIRPSLGFLAGFVGQQPKLHWFWRKGSEYQVQKNGICYYNPEVINERKEYKLVVENTGSLPIEITNVEYWSVRGGDQEEEWVRERLISGENNWISLDSVKGKKIMPETTETFSFRLNPRNRTNDEWQQEYLRRQVRIFHNGNRNTPLTLQINAQMGSIRKADNALLCIDFGTSNSVVTIQNNAHNVLFQSLDKLGGVPSGIRSLINFNYNQLYKLRDNDDRGLFLYGQEAEGPKGHSANLIQSMKSQLGKLSSYVLSYRVQGQEQRLTTEYKLQSVLNRFIGVLKTSAENNYKNLHPMVQEKIGGTATTVIFNKALLTHPVGMSEEALRIVYNATQSAGLNTNAYDRPVDFAYFKENYCLDEASAAIIALITNKDFNRIKASHEKILCVDIGGGTTDISTIEVNKRKFDNTFQKMYLEGMYFGGDTIDEIIVRLAIKGFFGAKMTPYRAALEHAINVQNSFYFINDVTTKYSFDSKIPLQLWTFYKSLREAAEIQKIASQCQTDFEIDLSNEVDVVLGENFPNLKCVISVQEIYQELDVQLERIKEKIEDAMPYTWQFSDITTLLFTGQTTRIAHIRDQLISFLQQKGIGRQCKIIPNQQIPFDPKLCVSQGIGSWYGNQDILKEIKDKPQIIRRSLGIANFSDFIPIKNLHAGRDLPFRALSPIFDGRRMSKIVLCEEPNQRGAEPRKVLEFDFMGQIDIRGEIAVVIKDTSSAAVIINGQSIKGKILLERGHL